MSRRDDAVIAGAGALALGGLYVATRPSVVARAKAWLAKLNEQPAEPGPSPPPSPTPSPEPTPTPTPEPTPEPASTLVPVGMQRTSFNSPLLKAERVRNASPTGRGGISHFNVYKAPAPYTGFFAIPFLGKNIVTLAAPTLDELKQLMGANKGRIPSERELYPNGRTSTTRPSRSTPPSASGEQPAAATPPTSAGGPRPFDWRDPSTYDQLLGKDYGVVKAPLAPIVLPTNDAVARDLGRIIAGTPSKVGEGGIWLGDKAADALAWLGSKGPAIVKHTIVSANETRESAADVGAGIGSWLQAFVKTGSGPSAEQQARDDAAWEEFQRKRDPLLAPDDGRVY